MYSSRIKIVVILIWVFSYPIFAQDISFPITVSDGAVSHTLTIGVNVNATSGFDTGIDVCSTAKRFI